MGRKKLVEEFPAQEVSEVPESQDQDISEVPLMEAVKEETVEVAPVIEIKPESNEVLFLRRLLHIQHSGGFGKHLDDIIYERIKELNG